MSTAAEAPSRVSEPFPFNIPRTYEGLNVCGFDAREYLGESISGIGTYLSLFDKGFPHLRAMLMSCVGDGATKTTVEVVSTIVITVIVLPIFCSLAVLYNLVSAGIKGTLAVISYLASARKEAAAPDGDEEEDEIDFGAGDAGVSTSAEPKRYERLFREAADHLCFLGLDCMGLMTRGVYLFSGAFAFSAFDDGNVMKAFKDYERDVLDGSMFTKMTDWAHRHGVMKAATGEESVE